jgi:hypothetical protein
MRVPTFVNFQEEKSKLPCIAYRVFKAGDLSLTEFIAL